MVECRKTTFNTLSHLHLKLQELHSLLICNWFERKILSAGCATSITWVIHLYYDQLHADLRSLKEGRIGDLSAVVSPHILCSVLRFGTCPTYKSVGILKIRNRMNACWFPLKMMYIHSCWLIAYLQVNLHRQSLLSTSNFRNHTSSIYKT